jgi:hypothetical protein
VRCVAAVNRLTLHVSRIIPGDWGMVGPGWLAQPLCSPVERLRLHVSEIIPGDWGKVKSGWLA